MTKYGKINSSGGHRTENNCGSTLEITLNPKVKQYSLNNKITIITGKKDREMPTEASIEYAKRAKEQGLNVELHVVKGAHNFKQLKGRTEIMKAAFK